jgi:hypothetical protein
VDDGFGFSVTSGTALIYYAAPRDRSYHVSLLWSMKSRTARTTDEVLKKLKRY